MKSRREFLTSIAMLSAGSTFASSAFSFNLNKKKLKVALVGTGARGTTFWGKRLIDTYSDILEFVGLSDINPGRLEFAKNYMKAKCPTYVDFDKMMVETKPDLLIVTTKDSTHHQFIIKGLDFGCDVLTEKPLTTDERKCQDILDAERRNKKNLIVGFNYRWNPYVTKVKELLQNNEIGQITSVDFHWYLNNYHGASYFRRWHGLRQSSGTLLVHKATHHFDLLNWWIDSDPMEVFAYGDLEHYGSKGPFRGKNCRNCHFTEECKYYWDITKDSFSKKMYADHEEHDGYIRDNCLFREEINIYDKMSAQIKYANNVVLNYSLNTYSPYEGWKVSITGHNGKIEAWLDVPWFSKSKFSQDDLHKMEMSQDEMPQDTQALILHKNWQDYNTIFVPFDRSGHGGGDGRLQDKIFRNPLNPDPYKHAAGSRDGAMAALIGIAARNSIETGVPVKIGSLTDLQPRAKRM
ncbi:MAG: Gfo/Idh/MocA family oxidoreductase [Cyclobacteriaceae bacterium]|nr:Gfo/Idh/MocA family oxidoreductase [Cyclobacteriaceae bacterium]